MKKIIKKTNQISQKITLSLFTLMVSMSAAAKGEGLEGRLKEYGGTVEALGSFLYIVAFVFGVALAISGLINIKKHADNPQQNPLTKPLIYFIAGAFLMGLTAWNTLIGETALGKDGTKKLTERSKLDGAK